jgi:low affinity Fe/Cu permease
MDTPKYKKFRDFYLRVDTLTHSRILSLMKEGFRKFAQSSAQVVGSPWVFAAALVMTVLWAATGPHFHYSDTWQLVINTGTSVSTFLVVFLIQNTQNRDCKVIHMKLDELIRAVQTARTSLVQMELLTDLELEVLQKEFQELRDQAASKLNQIEESRLKRVSRRGGLAPQ